MYLMMTLSDCELSLKGLGLDLRTLSSRRRGSKAWRLIRAWLDLVGFSDGSLSGDGNNGGYSWIVAVVENGAIREAVCVQWENSVPLRR